MKTNPSIIISTGAFVLYTASCGEKTATTEGSTFTTEAAAEATDGYPLDTCVVTGEKLGKMGEPYVIVHEGTTVKFCCKSCLKDFNDDPDKHIAMIKEADAD